MCGVQRFTITKARTEHAYRLLSKVQEKTSQTLVRLLRPLTLITAHPFHYSLIPISLITSLFYTHMVIIFVRYSFFCTMYTFLNPITPTFPLLFKFIASHVSTYVNSCGFALYLCDHPSLFVEIMSQHMTDIMIQYLLFNHNVIHYTIKTTLFPLLI